MNDRNTREPDGFLPAFLFALAVVLLAWLLGRLVPAH